MKRIFDCMKILRDMAPFLIANLHGSFIAQPYLLSVQLSDRHVAAHLNVYSHARSPGSRWHGKVNTESLFKHLVSLSGTLKQLLLTDNGIR